jgi:hypothetical protein
MPTETTRPSRRPSLPAALAPNDLKLDRLINDPTTVAQATRAAEARALAGRRRLVDPTTCERDYTAAELEFMQAMHAYKAKSGRMFPTWSEVLEVLQALGYEKAAEATEFLSPGASAGGAS